MAQDAVSGYISPENFSKKELKVYLARIKIKDYPDIGASEPVAVSTVTNDGYFAFKKSLISEKNALYRVYVKRVKQILKDTLQTDHLFLLSNSDSIRFQKGSQPFTKFTNSNPADKEWQKMRKFEASLFVDNTTANQNLSDAYLQGVSNYTKDSIQILMVKLIGIRQLDNRNLLEKDIAKNPDYYLALLKELKESELDRSEYLFLENKLAFLTTEVAENKFRQSFALNVFMGILLIGLIIFAYRFIRRKEEL